MTDWVTISGAGVTTATKFFGDAMNKISNMFNGVDVTDTVTINSAVIWTFENGAFKLRNPADTFSYLFTPAAIAADRIITLPLLTGNDTVVTEAFAQTITLKTIDGDNNTISNLAIGAEVLTTLTETEEIWIPAGAFISTATAGAEITTREMATNDVNFALAGFATGAAENIEFVWTPPANWNAGTVTFRLYWTNTAGLTTETIDFDLAAMALADNDALDTAYGTPQNVTDTWLAQNDLHITDASSAITIDGTPVAGEQVHFKLTRDVASDNLTGDADVLGIILSYGVNDIGTT